MENILAQIAECVERGKINLNSTYPADLKGKEGVEELTLNALETGIKPEIVLNEGLILGMKRIGEKFRDKKVFVPDVLIAAKAMNTGMVFIKPFFLTNEIQYKGKLIIGTVAGDVHDIGKNILGMILQSGGWEIIDLGINVPAMKFANAVEQHKPKAVLLSALLTTTMLNMAPVIQAVKAIDEKVKILVGGAPVNAAFANEIGADLYSSNPQGALDYLESLK